VVPDARVSAGTADTTPDGRIPRTGVAKTGRGKPLASPSRAGAAPTSRAGAAAPRRTVLYVEDDPVNVEIVRGAIEHREDWLLALAFSGAEALEVTKALVPDLFLLDINLGDTTGIELAQRLRQTPLFVCIPCVALSSEDTDDVVAAAMKAGFMYYLHKPLDLAQFDVVLDEVARLGTGSVA